MASYYGWECSFYVWGSCGIIWFIFWTKLVYETPDDHPRISKEEKNFINSNIQKSHSKPSSKRLKLPRAPLLKILTSVPVIANILTALGQNYGFYTILKMTPTYLNNIQHVSIENVGNMQLIYIFKAFKSFRHLTFINFRLYQITNRMAICQPCHIFAYGGFQCHGDGSPIILYELKD